MMEAPLFVVASAHQNVSQEPLNLEHWWLQNWMVSQNLPKSIALAIAKRVVGGWKIHFLQSPVLIQNVSQESPRTFPKV